MTIAITGATGQLGQLVVSALVAKGVGDKVVALVRSPEKAASLGVTARQAEYGKPETLRTALVGVQTLLLISSSEVGQRIEQHRNVIDAAKAAGVKRIVYTSLLHADTSPLSLATEHRHTELDLEKSGVAYTILRNGWYTENYTAGIPGALASGAFIGSAGVGKISTAARADYAEAAAKVLVESGHDNIIYELAGDTAYTKAEFASEVSKQSGRDIPYNNLPEAEYAAALATFGLPEHLAKAIASWDVGAASGALFDDGHALSQLLGRATTAMPDTVSVALAGK